ncbi:MAG: peptide chain release factor 1 [Candidatus Lambdaproteobacteria bacterium]|nr:peptide chain release factor 1 [Candidatus Lambdaproteobacteria bacterium]
MIGNLEEVAHRFAEITTSLSNPKVIADQAQYRQLSKEHAELSPIIEVYEKYRKAKSELDSQEQIVRDPAEDAELKALANEELPNLRKSVGELEARLKTLLLPKDPHDESNIVLEIRAGTGGDEAALFVGDLLRMYQKFAEANRWRVEVLSSSPSEAGGFKEVIVGVDGNEVYKRMKFESGVHRVQRVPRTETQGRIHTSTATVAVMPEADEIEVDIQPGDLRIDIFRSSGPGGQSVNTTDSAVRITHLPTGIVAQSQDEKSQHKNKARALKVLKARVYEQMLEEQKRQEDDQRRSMVGTGDRSERIRTYNFPQGRVTDHRIGLTLYRLEGVMLGDLEELVDGLLTHEQTELLKDGHTLRHDGEGKGARRAGRAAE